MLKLYVALPIALWIAVSVTSGQVKSPQSYAEVSRPIRPPTNNKPNHIIHRQEARAQPEPILRSKQATSIKTYARDGALRVTLSETHPIRYTKIESILGLLDRLAYAISKPVAIINIVRFIILAVSSLIMSTFMFPAITLDLSKRRHRDKPIWLNPFGHLNPSEVEGIIELITRNYDNILDRAGFVDRSSCRERSLCVIGDMMACDFPNFVVTVGRFAQQHLPPFDATKNKYTKALVLGLNQTDCDRAYKTNHYECPSFRDYVRSYFHTGTRMRREQQYWRQ